MTVAEQLFCAALQKEDLKIISKVKKRWLDEKEFVQLSFIIDYYKEHSELVPLKTFQEKFPTATGDSSAKTAFYLQELKDRYLYSTIADKVPGIVRGIKKEPQESFEKLKKLCLSVDTELHSESDTTVRYSDEATDRLKSYKERKETGGVTYLSMGNSVMDSLFYGYRRRDLITIGGKAGQGKTWLLCYLTYLLERVILDMREEGEEIGDILFISNEMDSEEIIERLDCIKFKLPYENFMKGTLPPVKMRKYATGLKALKDKVSPIRVVPMCSTIEELTANIGIYNPSVILIDGSYLMEPGMAEGWEKIVHVTRNLKRLSKSLGVPIINTTQLRKGAGKKSSVSHLDGQEDFAYSNSYVQDSDIAFRMYQDPDMVYHGLVGMQVVKGRRVRSGTTIMFENELSVPKFGLSVDVADDTTSTDSKRIDY